MANIGLFGGTFDPIHKGHLQCAAAARSEGGIDSVVFIPSARPPHKDGEYICGFNHRLTMLKRAVSGYEYFSISDCERRRPNPSYTIDTLDFFLNRAVPSETYHFIIGGDAFLDIESWYCWQMVLSRIDFIIIIRPGYDTSRLHDLLHRLHFTADKQLNDIWIHNEGEKRVRFLTTTTDDISSSDIRCRIAKNMVWKHLVPAKVADYIQEETLYC